MKGLLDDAHALAEQLRDTLDEASGLAYEMPESRREFRAASALCGLADRVEALGADIDLQRSALRGS